MRHGYGLCQLRDPGDAYIDVGDLVPGGKVYHACLGKAENRLKFPDCRGGVGTVKAVGGHMGDGAVYGGNGVQLLLKLPYFLSGGADGQVLFRPGGGDPGDLFRGVDVDGRSVKMAQDLNRAVAPLT